MTPREDENFMRHALSLANRAIGRVAPNPAVGCVIVKNDIVIGTGWTQDGGRPHAETQALQQANNHAKGATAYVSLEPCAHHGKTPPCANALAEAGIARAVIACSDPDPRVSGKGIDILQKADITVTTGILEEQAKVLNAGFILKTTQKRPFVTLKIATSADHKIAEGPGKRTQISSTIANRYTHWLRSRHDAILVGKNTAVIDKPKLTTRIEGYAHHSEHIILAQDKFPDIDTRDLKAVLAHLADQGITRLLVEGGAQIHRSFLDAGLVDEFHWVKSPKTIGPQGVDALYNHDISKIEGDFGLKKQKIRALGEDLLEIYTAKA